jgi:hypothetical protein
MARRKPVLAPYHHFTKAQWSALRDGQPMTLTAADIERLRTLSDPISLEEAEEVYLPLTRLLAYYVEAIQGLHNVSTRFLNTPDEKVPFIIGVAGSVAVGKSTTARILQALLQRWPQGRPCHHRWLSPPQCGAGRARHHGAQGLSRKLRPAPLRAVSRRYQVGEKQGQGAGLFAPGL